MSRQTCRVLLFLAVLIAVPPSNRASAETNDPVAIFALIVGVNKSVDSDLTPLRYADDDAAQYLEFFRTLGAKTYLLADLDENTRRVHVQAAAETSQPTRAALAEAVAELRKEISRARKRGVRAVFYFVYAGHGNVRDGKGYLSLSDAHLTSQQIGTDIVEKIDADQTHLIVDACQSYFLANSRGPGGSRRALHDFSSVRALATDKNVGMLLSTSAANESHEWEGVQAGVFSHEVRSGLYGAADANGDGQISYREIAAFVTNANASIANERFRPDVYASPPQGDGQLVDIRHGLKRRIEVKESARYLLEDERGVRLAQFHNAPNQAVWLVRPAVSSKLYVTQLDGGHEFAIDRSIDIVELASLTPTAPRTAARGAAHDAFSLIFKEPFDWRVVEDYSYPESPPGLGAALPVDTLSSARGWKYQVGWGAIVTGATATAAGSYFTWSASRVRGRLAADASHEEVVRENTLIRDKNRSALVLYGIAGAAATTGLVLLFWPEKDASKRGADLNISADGALLTYKGDF